MMQGTPTAWQYTDTTKAVVIRTYPDGSMESCLATRADVAAWVKAGNTIQPVPTSN
ncbi:hypothetical protein [Paludibacterium purpuratum]|uniref:Uncharacterized protein n=1 Tax=Paludibacterium purpuratum TaxID=1144873 RepID=A0A4R7B810_9NEIS|nr:hypothetical protein [Paludibacterium purpuratum]TDR79992.1 hypothetical protein DFP86_106132 [Paludibacterium purpuratum]